MMSMLREYSAQIVDIMKSSWPSAAEYVGILPNVCLRSNISISARSLPSFISSLLIGSSMMPLREDARLRLPCVRRRYPDAGTSRCRLRR